MRNLKKVLSMVLVVAMIASMLVVGAAAATEETTNYEEAASVVTGIGIIEGDETGMNYQGLVTREQAAKIVTYMLLGKSTAESLKTSTAPFADVAATRWSAPYIAYLKGQGIISGVSDTEFDPTGNVTGIALAKMLLSAAGYGQNGEFEGAAWDINTITFANDNGVFAGTLAADLAAPATREEAMLYMFNTLTGVPVVKWNSTFESYYTGKSALDPVTGDVIATETDADDPYAYTLGWTKYALKQVTGTDTDDYGRPAATWTANGASVADAVANVEPTATLTGKVYSKDIYAALGKSVVNNMNVYGISKAVTVYVDGDLEKNVITPYTATYGTPWGDILAGEYVNQVSANGATVELYLTQNDTDGHYELRIVVVYEYIGEVTKVDTTNDQITIDKKYTVDGAAGYTKGDVVVYTKGCANGSDVVTQANVVEPFIGTYTGTDWMSMYVIDGVSYSLSHKNDSVSLVKDTSYEIYTDSQGNILRADVYDVAGATGAYQYVYIVGSQAVVEGEDLIEATETKVALDAVYANGGNEVVYAAVKTDKAGDYIVVNGGRIDIKSAGKDIVPTGWYAYTTNDAGEVTLKAINNDYANITDAITTEPGYATISGISKIANSKTVLSIVNEDGDIVSYTGIANFPKKVEIGMNNGTLYTYGYESGVATTITVFVGAAPVDSKLNLAYCAFQWSDDSNGTTYMFYINGAPQFITLDVSSYVEAYSKIDFNNMDETSWVAWANYNNYVPQSGYVYDLTVSDGEYSATRLAAYGADGADEDLEPDTFGTAGTVNAGGLIFGATYDTDGYGVFNSKTYVYDAYEWATIDTVDENYFTTVAIEPNEDNDYTDTVAGRPVKAYTYYYDANTVVYDVTGAGATEISEGDVFVAYVDTTASAAYLGASYASIIWIVG